MTTPVQMFNYHEPIPGYVLEERIGAGGYGEVWRAKAPGGLLKAVKIVNGPLSSTRAERELKALNRIRQVQHPLLLSLERFEIVQDHLVIVSELAQGSLKDRFEEYVKVGLPGIPREELLGYLRDAADALDYLYREHSLQHLDVKPENLLLLANRVKVADFGLVKDLHDACESLVSGLTPLYAAPELFDGRPNRFSDQYSLAIVYQEMLTGEPPFGGKTAAQLAAQHMHGSPILAPLPRGEQPVIARALSKNPERRFGSCTELLEHLLDASRQSRSRRSSAVALPRDGRAAGTTTTTAFVDTAVEPLPIPAAAAAKLLPPLDLSAAAATGVPTVFIGVGGAGLRTLVKLKQKLAARFGNPDDFPAFQFVGIDTDVQDLIAQTRSEDEIGLRARETVAIPLREAATYRDRSDDLLEWMSRRWLYNIPRSLQTEGLRPLGRLGLVENFAAVRTAIEFAFRCALDSASIRVTSDKTGLPFRERAARAVVLASTCGGTGGGGVIDLAYFLRSLQQELNAADAETIGVLCHATPRQAARRDLAVANTLSFLSELQHLSSAAVEYPGEPACGIASCPGGTPPFTSLLLQHWGDELAEEQAAAAAERTADFVYQFTATPASTFFAAVRRESAAKAESAADAISVGTFGIARIGESQFACLEAEAEGLATLLVDRWTGCTPRRSSSPLMLLREHQQAYDEPDPEIRRLVERFAAGMDLDFVKLTQWVTEVLQRQISQDPNTYFDQLLVHARRELERQQPVEHLGARLRAAIDDAVIGSPDDTSYHPTRSLQEFLADQVASAASCRAEMIDDWVAILIDSPKSRLAGARQACRWFRAHLETIERDAGQSSAQLAEQLAHLLRLDVVDRQHLLDYAAIRLRHVSTTAIETFVRSIKSRVVRLGDRVEELSSRLRSLVAAPGQVRPPPGRGDGEFENRIRERRVQMFTELDLEIAQGFFRSGCRLSQMAEESSGAWHRLQLAIRKASRVLVAQELRKLNVANLLRPEASADAGETVSAALPRLADCGGERRLLLICPETAHHWDRGWCTPLEELAQQTATVVFDTDHDVTVCFDVQHLPLANIVTRLVGQRRDYLSLASRLHTRIDIEWPPLR